VITQIYEGNEALEGTPFDASNYYGVNFNDFASGMVFLFQLLIANNWNVFMDAVVLVSGDDVGGWARLYCISYWVLAVTIVFLAVESVLSGLHCAVCWQRWRHHQAWMFG
jgi:hypothetical protein